MSFPKPPKLPPPPHLSTLLAQGNPLREIVTDARETIRVSTQEIGNVAAALRVEEPAESAEHLETLEAAETHGEIAPAKGTACLQCVSDHLATVGGALSEAVRFARGSDNGVGDPECQKRLMVAREEINIGERIDLHPAEVAKLDDKQRAVAQWVAPKFREIRHGLQGISSIEDIEDLSAKISQIRSELANRMQECKLCAGLLSLKEFQKRKGA